MAEFLFRPRRIAQPKGRAVVDKNSPLGRVLDYLWLGNDIAGKDLIRGVTGAPASGVTLANKLQGTAIYNGSGLTGTNPTFPAGSTFPIVMVGYGYVESTGSGGQLGRIISSATGYEFSITASSSTVVTFNIRFNFGTAQSITVTLPTTLNVPICAIVQVFSATDYRLYVNGFQTNGTASPGTLGAGYDTYEPVGNRVTGGSWLYGFGFGRSISDEQALRITANPTLLWQTIQGKSRSLTFDAAVAASDLSGSATLDDITASATLTGGTASTLSGGATLDDITASGGGGGGSPSILSGGATLDDVTASGGATGGGGSVSGNAQLGDVDASGSLISQGTLTTLPMVNWAMPTAPMATTNIPAVMVIRISDRVVVLSLANQVTDGLGVLTITDSAIARGTAYLVLTFEADGSLGGFRTYTAT